MSELAVWLFLGIMGVTSVHYFDLWRERRGQLHDVRLTTSVSRLTFAAYALLGPFMLLIGVTRIWDVLYDDYQERRAQQADTDL